VSSIDDTTVYECMNDRADGCGPDTDKDLLNRLSDKPWDQLIATYPDIHDMARTLKPGLKVTFANSFGELPGFQSGDCEC